MTVVKRTCYVTLNNIGKFTFILAYKHRNS